MPRVSRAEAERRRRQVIDSTARLIREKGADQVSVPQAMATAGLTHGGFYRHFASKDDLVAQALGAAFAERREAMDHLADEPAAEGRTPRAEFLARYLSTPHRDNPGQGCAAAALAADAARAEPGTPLRTAFTAGLRDLVDGFQYLPDPAEREAALADLSTLVGALLLARASEDPALSAEFLAAARHRLSAPTPAPAADADAPSV
ncbi:TetR/AcrR family transcriptional repressor of nem operon [Kitasatospora sp. MAA19]|uniref:TetR/AcrR family transcriptional regulator n=1 Tax=Kitasatospora sp. MAA19 TaxID=3035090 RepID=UPI0024772D10|nr:TetR/AcrR family transcriptional regulator [Kitasatospora sp. MAA19]MDH6705895.1 TetR/AcrR family transcriptional repressor of nem operon [Kitasatospora sp. MAA19]